MSFARHTKTWRMALLLTLCCMVPGLAGAHSLRAVCWEGGAFVVEASFGGGDIASYAKVVVLSPGNNAQEFQSGVTDAHGRFAFVPDKPGCWRIIIDAGMGHKTALAVDVGPGSVQD